MTDESKGNRDTDVLLGKLAKVWVKGRWDFCDVR